MLSSLQDIHWFIRLACEGMDGGWKTDPLSAVCVSNRKSTSVYVMSLSQVVTGLCYVPDTQTLWVAAGTDKPIHYEPRSGDNV